MESRPHLIIEAGPDTGREISIATAEGLRAGRSSRNDIVLQDSKTSRYHCRFFIKPGDGLYVSDLGSANQTLVNNQAAREVRLHVDDRITLGDTVFKVVDAATNAQPSPLAAPTPPPVVDLGLHAAPATRPTVRQPLGRKPLIIIMIVVITLAVATWLPRFLRPAASADAPAAAPAPPPPLSITYEKLLADTNRIFRYVLKLAPDAKITVTVDDTESTHFREEGVLREELMNDLVRFIDRSGIASLQERYQGIQAASLNQWELTITLGKHVTHCLVMNRPEPPEFKAVREKLENIAQLELGLWAVQYPPDKLIEMANKAYLDGRKFYDERDVQHGNLAAAIRQLKDADFFLKTVDPKPEFHANVLAGLEAYRVELDRRYVDQNFLATRAMQTKNMTEAAEQLRILCDILGDRADPRYEEAWRKLLEVESRINVKQK